MIYLEGVLKTTCQELSGWYNYCASRILRTRKPKFHPLVPEGANVRLPLKVLRHLKCGMQDGVSPFCINHKTMSEYDSNPYYHPKHSFFWYFAGFFLVAFASCLFMKYGLGFQPVTAEGTIKLSVYLTLALEALMTYLVYRVIEYKAKPHKELWSYTKAPLVAVYFAVRTAAGLLVLIGPGIILWYVLSQFDSKQALYWVSIILWLLLIFGPLKKTKLGGKYLNLLERIMSD